MVLSYHIYKLNVSLQAIFDLSIRCFDFVILSNRFYNDEKAREFNKAKQV